ncbi:hypothetical protein, partial [Acinetobacter baumannii]|uniref:hypothetical protein n=1 Tax=Acinetobacter baumannii TaxID=470 RepID=UPI002737BEDF
MKSQQKIGSAKLKTIKILMLVSYTGCVVFLGQNNVIKIKGAVVDKVKYPSNPTVFRAVVLDSH